MKIKHLIYTLIISIITLGCGSDDLEAVLEIPLLANAGSDQIVAPFTEVTLDGSASTGPISGFNYQWIYQGSETINLSSTSDPIVTFTPEKNGFYQFTLRLTTSDGKFNEAFVNIQVTGAVVLDASSFTEDILNLKDIDGLFGSGADYLINSDFTIPAGKTMSIANGEDVTIAMADGAGIIINGSFNITSTTLLQASATSWKGILIDGGTLNGSSTQMTISDAGGSAFDGHEAAAMTFVNDGKLSWTASMTISNTISDLGIVLTSTTSSSWDTSQGSVVVEAKVPVRAPIGYVSQLSSNVFTSGEYEYVHLITSGASITEGSVSGSFNFTGSNNPKFLIDGDFTAGSTIVANGSTIYMKENTGIVGIDMNFNDVTIEGLDGANWKGLSGTSTMSFNNTKIIDAGSATHNTGSFSTSEKAAIFGSPSSTVSIRSSSEITNSGGYGVYLEGNNPSHRIQTTNFEDNANYDVSMDIQNAFSIKNGITWGANIPVLLRGGNISANTTIPELSDGRSYLVEGNVNVISGSLTLDPGVNLKFQADKGLSVSTRLTAEGTTEKPIIFDGEAGTSGSWKGIELLHQYRMEYSTVTNGGSSAFIGQDASNIIFGGGNNTLTSPQTNYKFDNNTVSNGAGEGSQVKLGKFNPLIDNSTNTFENNVSQDSDGDGLPDNFETPGCENDPDC